ncbi:MAG: LuxR C-terminal-related transcriptional regulator [Planktomarina sp.]|nr:LuxR C-terminal-related transcriptional regulator [Planktomarina sp.]
MANIKIQKAFDELHNGGGILYPFRNGYEKLAVLLETVPSDAWRYDESVLGGLVLYLLKQGQAIRAKSYLRARDLQFEKTYWFEFLELMVALHLGERVSEKKLTTWRRLERKLPLQDTLLLGLYYNVLMAMFVRVGNLEEARNAGQQSISCFREEGHSYLEHFIHIHLADIDVVEGRLRRALRGLTAAERCLSQSGLSYGNEIEVIEVIKLAVAYERGEFVKVRNSSTRLRESLLKGDSWSELFFQLTRICVLSTYFLDGLRAAQHELELFQADYVRRHAGRATTIDVLSAMIWRLEWNPNEAAQHLEILDGVDMHSAIGGFLLAEQRVLLHHEEPMINDSPRGKIVSDLQTAQSQRGQTRRNALERSLWNAFKEGQIAPFLENRDALLGMASQITSISGLRRHPIMLRLVNKILKSVNQSYVIPETLRKIGFNRRQYRVVAALQAGATNKQIARQLGTTESTVKYHLTSIYKMIHVTKRYDLIEFMYKNRIFINY